MGIRVNPFLNFMGFEKNIINDLGVSRDESFEIKKNNLEFVQEILENKFGKENLPKEFVLEMLDIRTEIKNEIEKDNFVDEISEGLDNKIKSLSARIYDPGLNKDDIQDFNEQEEGGLELFLKNGEKIVLGESEENLLGSLRLYFDSYRLAHNASKFRSNFEEVKSKIIQGNEERIVNFYSEKEKVNEVISDLQEKYQKAGFSNEELEDLIKTCDIKDLLSLEIHEINILVKVRDVISRFLDGDKKKYIGLSTTLLIPAFIRGYSPMLFADAFKDNSTDIKQIILYALVSVGGAGISLGIEKYYKDFTNQNYKKEAGFSQFVAKNLTEMPPDETKRFGLETIKNRAGEGKNSYDGVLNTLSFDILPTVTTLATSAVVLYDKSPVLAGGTILASGITVILDKYFQKVGKFWEKQRGVEKTEEQVAKKLDEQLKAHMEIILAGEKEKFFNDIKSFIDREKIAKSDRNFFQVLENTYFRFTGAINLTLVGLASLLAGGSADKTIAAVLYSGNFNAGINNLLSAKRELLKSLRSMMQMELMFNGYAKEEDKKEKNRISVNEIKNNDIALRDVNVELEGKKILDNVNLDIPSGSLAYLEGASGAGKTTLMKIIAGYYKPNSGEVSLGGVEVESISKAGEGSIYNKIAYLSQFPYLFDDSLKNNLLFGLGKEVDDKKILEVLKDVGLSNRFSRNIEEKIFGGVGDSGKTSGGETARIGLARVLLKIRNADSKIVFLDEPTASVDKETKIEIAKIINNEKLSRSETTFIVISHDEQFVEMLNCSIRVKMDKGKIES